MILSKNDALYVNVQKKTFFVSDKPDGEKQVATIFPAKILAKNNAVDITNKFAVVEEVSDLGKGLFLRMFRIANYNNEPFEIQIVLEAETAFVPSHWTIPCVMYNGNSFGDRNSPKHIEKDGKPWVFSYDRSGIPSCVISETKEFVFSTMASDSTAASLQTSGSVEKLADGHFRHKIFYPVTESPLSYTDKNVLTDRHDTFLTLVPGGSVEAESYLFAAKPRWLNYGYYNLLHRVFPVFKHRHLPAMDSEMLYSVSMGFLKKSRVESNGFKYLGRSYRDYTHPIGNHQKGGPWDGMTLKMIEDNPSLNHLMSEITSTTMGFSAQAFLAARMLLKESFRTGDAELRSYVLAFLDDWLGRQLPNGLISTAYPRYSKAFDLCNLGWGAGEGAKIYSLLRKNGVSKPNYLEFSEKLCSFFVENFRDNDPFGKVWSINGECLVSGGCTGAFMMKAMLELYEVCSQRKYLDCARRAFDFYMKTELNQFRCTAGAIDCDSVDKESSYPFITSGLSLYRHTGKRKYLRDSEKAATYFLSWMFCYDALYETESDFQRLGYHTSGGTAISVEHHAIDPYAAIIVPDLHELSEHTQNPLWQEAGDLIWANASQCIAGPNGLSLHGMMRPPGSQNECFAQTRWTKYRSSPEERGHLNDFIGFWLPCFKLYAKDKEENRHQGES